MRLLLRGGFLFRKVTIGQWRYGAAGVKPTTLLHCHGDLPRALRECELPDVSRPTDILLGRDDAGAYKTAQAKEYPSALSRSFAKSFSDRLVTLNLSEQHTSLAADPELHEFIRLSACIECGTMQPDYQPLG